VSDNQGYLANPKHKMEFNKYPGMPGESTLPSFEALMETLEVGGDPSIVDSFAELDGVQEAIERRRKDFFSKGSFVIRKSMKM
jgi:hypothetical protein